MKNLNNKLQEIKTQMKGFYGGIALIALVSSASVSQAMNVPEKDCIDKELVGKKFRIKNNRGEYMYISDENKIRGGDNNILAGTKEKADVFIFEKVKKQGWRIKKDGTNQYLLSSSYSHYGFWDRYLAAKESPVSVSQYFKIIKEDNKDHSYLIFNKKYMEYLFFSDTYKINGRSFGLSNGDVMNKSSFELENFEIIDAPPTFPWCYGSVGASSLNEDKIASYQKEKDEHDQRRLERHIDFAQANDNLSLHHQIEIVNISDEQEDRHLALSIENGSKHDNP